MKVPQFEDPIDTLGDLVDQNITIFQRDLLFEHYKDLFYVFNNYSWVNTSEWEWIADTMVPASDCLEIEGCADINGTMEYFMKYHVHGNKTHAFILSYLYQDYFMVMPDKSKWYRSQSINSYFGNPFVTVMTSRNWILNEVNSFILTLEFQVHSVHPHSSVVRNS